MASLTRAPKRRRGNKAGSSESSEPRRLASRSDRARISTQPGSSNMEPSSGSWRFSSQLGTHGPHDPVRQHPAINAAPSNVPSENNGVGTYGSLTAPLQDNNVDDVEGMEEIVMSVGVSRKRTIGCAYYVARWEKLLLMEDVQCGNADVVDALKLFVQPTVVLASTKCDDVVLDHLDPHKGIGGGSQEDGQNSDDVLPYLVQLRPDAEFNFDSACNKLAELQIAEPNASEMLFMVPGDNFAHSERNENDGPNSFHRQQQSLRLSGWINLESRNSVGCAGALLAYLQRRRAAIFLPGDQAAAAMFRIDSIGMFTLKDSMFANGETVHALQIMSTESHPNAQNQGPVSKNWSSGGAKEGLSVYGLFHPHAKTTQGRYLLLQYFLRPSLDLEVLNQRLDTIDALLRPDNSSAVDHLSRSLAKIKDMHLVTANLRRGFSNGVNRNRSVSTHVWPALRDFFFYTLQIADAVNEMSGMQQLAIAARIAEKFHRVSLARLGDRVCRTIDIDATKEEQRTVIRPGVDAGLDEIKQVYDGIEDLLSTVAANVAQNMPREYASDMNVIFFPQIGFLICIQLDPSSGRGIYEGSHNDVWEKMFMTESRAYYKNSHTVLLDEEYGDVYGQICDMEIEIAQGLGEEILQHDVLLHEVSDLCGELDALHALARGAHQYSYARPQLTDRNIIRIQAGRHPLQELAVPNFVPNDTWIVGGDRDAAEATVPQIPHERDVGPNMKMMTGPNYSGKSIYLKQVGIIVYMAHIGSYVPVTAATIGLTDKILTRISTRESVSRAQSAFMIDLQQAATALNTATHRSLIVVDEFGKGTDSSDGAGLAAAVFEHLLSRGSHTPKVLGATHFHEIFESGFLAPRPSLEFGHMEIQVDQEASEIGDQVTYLYNLRTGRSNKSLGIFCAASNGIASSIVERAEELSLLASRGDDLVERCAALPPGELDDLEHAETTARKFLATDIEEAPRRMLDELLAQASSMMSVAS